MRVLWMVIGCGLVTAACAPPPRPAPGGAVAVVSRVAVGAAEEVVDGEPEAVLAPPPPPPEARGFAISALTGPGGTVEAATRADPAWASCPTVTVRDPFSEALRSRRAEAGEVATRVTVTAVAATPTTTRVTVRALHLGTYINSFTGNPQEAACRSSSVIERELLAAIAAG